MHGEYSHILLKHVGVWSALSIHFVRIQVLVGEGEPLCSMKDYVKRMLTSEGSISRICWPIAANEILCQSCFRWSTIQKTIRPNLFLKAHRCTRCLFTDGPCCFGLKGISGRARCFYVIPCGLLGSRWYWAISSSILIKWDNKDFTFDQSCASAPEPP